LPYSKRISDVIAQFQISIAATTACPVVPYNFFHGAGNDVLHQWIRWTGRFRQPGVLEEGGELTQKRYRFQSAISLPSASQNFSPEDDV
jgi:hypothetical protein